jgi:hypothetical protein
VYESRQRIYKGEKRKRRSRLFRPLARHPPYAQPTSDNRQRSPCSHSAPLPLRSAHRRKSDRRRRTAGTTRVLATLTVGRRVTRRSGRFRAATTRTEDEVAHAGEGRTLSRRSRARGRRRAVRRGEGGGRSITIFFVRDGVDALGVEEGETGVTRRRCSGGDEIGIFIERSGRGGSFGRLGETRCWRGAGCGGRGGVGTTEAGC